MLPQQLHRLVVPILEHDRVERRQPAHQLLPMGANLPCSGHHLIIDGFRFWAGRIRVRQLRHITTDLVAQRIFVAARSGAFEPEASQSAARCNSVSGEEKFLPGCCASIPRMFDWTGSPDLASGHRNGAKDESLGRRRTRHAAGVHRVADTGAHRHVDPARSDALRRLPLRSPFLARLLRSWWRQRDAGPGSRSDVRVGGKRQSWRRCR